MMKLSILTGVVVLAGSMVFTDSALAGRVGHRQANQQKRIHQGIRSGELTRREVRVLEREQHAIQVQKRRAGSDGVVTKRERLRLEKEQDRASRHIYRLKHNEGDR